MIDITHKPTTLREAIAEATVTVSKAETIAAVKERRVPKGAVIEAARIAGLFGIKRTADMIPDCHPLPVEHAEVTSSVQDMSIVVTVKVRTIYRTGVEVEAMHGASVAALTIYDMLKPIDKGITIDRIRLVEKKGGKSDWKDQFEKMPRAAVLVISDSVSAGKKEDKAGKAIGEKLKAMGVELAANALVPDEPGQIAAQVKAWAEQGIDLILTTGGTGLSPRDVTPEATADVLEREIRAIPVAMWVEGLKVTPNAMLSRAVAGTRGSSLIVNLPGSEKAARENLAAVLGALEHALHMIAAEGHG